MAASGPSKSTMPQEAEAPQARVVIGLDTSLVAREALSLAARLAASVDARLKGVFVEDENLLTMADLPFAREISFSGEVRSVDPERMLRAMKAQAESARRMLARIAAEAHVDWSFDVRRGRPLASLAAGAGASDTLVLRSHGATSLEVGRAVRAATRDAHADVLLVGRGVGVRASLADTPPVPRLQAVMPGRPLISVDEGSSIGESCSAFAERLAQRIGAPFRRFAAKGKSPADLAEGARGSGAGLIVVNAAWLGDDDDAARLSAAAGCPVLILGSERAPGGAPLNKEDGG
ncbi:hypothetical protein Plav_0741 [Parvibaculum lavamentivorans DS-1]|uniref:UspA domain protein n=2 Tax=Parvibaculum lavamentivorans TaxID=256618 RepID=A7HR31_PARL1|nr:hypothetical protein Plav_0741 [Parvibaculum lavamentivorans DS-1]